MILLVCLWRAGSWLLGGFLQLQGWGCSPASGCRLPSPGASRALGCVGFRNCGARALLPRGVRNLPRLEIKPVSTTLAGRLSNTRPAGSQDGHLLCVHFLLPNPADPQVEDRGHQETISLQRCNPTTPKVTCTVPQNAPRCDHSQSEKSQGAL